MQWFLLLCICITFSAISSLLVIGAGFLLLPILTSVLSLSSLHIAAFCDLLTASTTLASLSAEFPYQTIHFTLAKKSVFLSLPGIVIGTLLSAYSLYDHIVWLFTAVTSILLLILSYKAFSISAKTFVKSRTWQWVLHLLIGISISATGLSGVLFFIFLYDKIQKLTMAQAIATAQFAGVLISLLSTIQHAQAGFHLNEWEMLLILFSSASAWLGARIAHFYSMQQLKILYLIACLVSSAWLMTHLVDKLPI